MAPNPSFASRQNNRAGIGLVAMCLLALSGPAQLEAGQTATAGLGQGGFVVAPPDGTVRAPTGGAPPRDQARRSGSARIRGRVVAADTGQPLRRATVRATSPELREAVSTMTDGDGLYEFKELVAGRYTVSASKGSYASLSYGQTRPSEPGRPIALTDNQTIEKIDIRLPRGGVITGVITDEFGDPVPDAMVMPLRQQFVQGRRRLMPAGRSATSNDIGGFRLFGLPPGAYYLSAVFRPQAGFQDRSDVRTGYAPTYFPGTADLASAQRLTVGVGQSLNDINLTLVPTQIAQVSGSVIGANGEPITMGAVIAQLRGASLAMVGGPPTMVGGPPTVGSIRPDGTFTISGVPPGEYILSSMGMGASAGAVSRATVAVNGADINGIQLVPSVPVTLSGRLVIDGGTTQSLSGKTVQLTFIDPAGQEFGPGMLSTLPATPREDLTFEAAVHPGRVAIRLMGDPRWQLKSVRVDGADVTDNGFDVGPGRSVNDVEVELTSQRQEVSGLVTRGNGQPATNYTVVVFAQDRERWGPTTRYIATGRPDQAGRFRVGSLPPGDYQAVAVEYVEPGGWMDPDFLDSVVHAAKPLSLNTGETASIELTLVEPR